MKDRGKAVAVSSSSNWFSDYYSSSELPCKKHPFSSSVGICAYCLKDRLIKLVCSDCGEQRLSSCSCSDISTSYPNSSSVVDIGSVGRISFLIENDKDGFRHSHSHSSIKSKSENRSESTVLLKRSSSTSTSVDVKRGSFWKFGRLFRKKRGVIENNVDGVDEKSEMWDLESMGVSRSRSVCGFRGGFDDSEGNITLSTGRPSVLKKDGHADSEKKKSGGKIDRLFQSEDVFGCVKRDGPSMVSENGSKSIRKGGLIEFDGSFSVDEDPGFIDLKLGLSSESKPEFSCLKNDNFLKSASSFITRDGNLSGDESQSFDYFREGMLGNGTSCRITVNNNEIKKCKKSFKVWKWIVKHHSSTAGRPSWQKDEHDSKI